MLAALLTIALLHWVVLLVPGFNFVLIGQLAAAGSRRAALCAVAGMTSATLVWAWLAVGGVGIVFKAHPSLRLWVQLAGGVYLLHLAWKLWRSSASPLGSAEVSLDPAAAFRAGFITSALNPKIALFYGSVFATALPANPPPWLVIAAVLLVYVNSVVWHSSLALLLSRPWLQTAYLRHHRVMQRMAASLVGVYGARLMHAAAREAT